MATLSEWVEGARPRTLPAALAPVLAGAAIAAIYGAQSWGVVALCFAVSLALQIGVNYANDYSDGIRGTDENRTGPMRLVGSGAATPASVRNAAFIAFGVAAVAGLVIVLITGHWWLLGVGAAAILAAWFYTGGKHPYGYMGLGEVFVFIFFGLVAVAGTCFVILGRVPLAGWAAAVSMGALACAILVANNLRDLVSDREVGKRTLATWLGDRHTRSFFLLLVIAAFSFVVLIAMLSTPWALVGLLGVVPGASAATAVAKGAQGKALIGVLQLTGIAELVVGAGLLVGALLLGSQPVA